MIKTSPRHVHYAFSTFLWRPLHDYDVKPPNLTFYGGCGHKTTNFPSSFWTWRTEIRKNSTPGKVACIWHIERVQIGALEFERTQILFLTTFSCTAVVVVVNHSYDYRPNCTPLSPVTITNQCHNKRVLRFFLSKLIYIKAIESFFPVLNTRGVGRILPAPLVFISGYANTENVFYCLNIIFLGNSCFLLMQ